jgi:hypothetical protein
MSFSSRTSRVERLLAEQASLEAHRSEARYAERTWRDPFRLDLFAIFDEISVLKSSRAVHYRAGQRIEPVDIPGRLLGEDYTPEQLRELAISRALEKRGYSTAEVAELLPQWVVLFEDMDRQRAERGMRPRGVRSR